jgi:universal stress protein A
MKLNGPILAAVDLSAGSEEALQQAADLARGLGTTVLVGHVVPELIPDGSVFAPYRDANASVQETVQQKARDAMQAEIDRVLGEDVGPVDILIETGSPHAGLLRQVERSGARLVAVGPGSIGMDVARHTHVSVLVARRSPVGPVIAATDFSEASAAALEVGASEARRRGVSLHLVHAFDIGMFALGQAPAPAAPYLSGASPIALEGLDDLQKAAKSQLENSLQELGVAGEVHVVAGSPARSRVKHAETVGAGLIVVGTHGRSGLARLTMGSTAARAAEAAPCSVLVVR